MRRILILLLAMAVGLFATNVFAGGSPKGKPFIEIAGQMVEVQGSVFDLEQAVADLTTRVDTTEELIDNNNAAIANLHAANDLIEQQIIQLINDTAANSAEITSALASILISLTLYVKQV